MTSEAGGAKLCCKCGKDLAGAYRIKDSDGRYWCENCHRDDRLVKKFGFTEAGKSTSSAAKTPADAAKAKKIKLLLLVGALVLAAVLLNMFVF